jgi:hypothetical protein
MYKKAHDLVINKKRIENENLFRLSPIKKILAREEDVEIQQVEGL